MIFAKKSKFHDAGGPDTVVSPNNTLEHSDGKIAHISTHVLCTEGGEEEMQEVKDVPKQVCLTLG